MPFFPMFLDLNGKKILIIGGGKTALRKAEKLLDFGPQIHLVSPVFDGELLQLAAVHPKQVVLYRRAASPADAAGTETEKWAAVIAASDDADLNHAVAMECGKLGIPVNTVDDAAYCTFFFPALAEKGDLCIGVSTAGASPTAASDMRQRIQQIIPEDMDVILEDLRKNRQRMLRQIPDDRERAAAMRQAYYDRVNTAIAPGSVALVGAGCGKADLITVRGLNLLRQCDALVYDDLIDTDLLRQAQAGTELYYVGKRGGRTCTGQEEICALLIRLAGEGKRVVRLKGGDPYVFGRGGEEMRALKEAGIPAQEVPGISSAIAIPAQAGIPVTLRGMSRSLHIVTGQTEGGGLPDCLPQLAQTGGTLVFLMGLHHLREICESLQMNGMPGDTPVALVSGGCAEDCGIRSDLADISRVAEEENFPSPAVFVVGETAGIDLRSDLM